MTSRSKVDWRVPEKEWEAFKDFIHEKYGEIEGYVGREVESAMREWADMDRGSDNEKVLDRLIRAAGRRPADRTEKKPPSSDRFVDADTTRASCYVHSDVRAAFTSFVDDTDDRLGVALARALREYRQGGRDARIGEKLDRIADDAEDFLSEIADDGESESMSLRKKRTINICRRFADRYEIKRDELHAAIADVAGETVIDAYEGRVLDRMGYAQHPVNEQLLLPIDDVRNAAENLDLPGPDAPAIDRKPYRDLSREEKVEGLRIELARKAYSRGGGASVAVSKVHDGIFDGKGSRNHIQSLMNEAAECNGYSCKTSSRSGKDYITANWDEIAVIPHISEQIQSEREDTTETEDTDTTDGQQENLDQEPEQDQSVESEAADQMDQLMNAQAARTDGGRDAPTG